jgi:nitrate reductase gamma subunit
MEQWLEWARGPMFRFALLFMTLGIIRLLALNVLNIVTVIRRAGDKNIPLKTIFAQTVQWLLPCKKMELSQLLFSIISFLFHISVIIVAIFLGAHIVLWERGLGIHWPALNQILADVLTLIAIAAVLVLLCRRIFSKATRALNRFQDYALLVLIGGTVLSGYLAMAPSINPFSYTATMLVHVMSGNLIFILIPVSKLSHVVLFPTTQLISELGWHLDPDSGQNVAVALGKENDPV